MVSQVMSVDISHLFKQRTDPEFFSVWYNTSDGRITDIGPHSTDDKGTFIIGSGEPYLTLLAGDVSFKEYVVAYDTKTEKNNLMHITEWTKLLGEKHELQLIDFITEQDNSTQFFLNFYKDQRKCELIINHESFSNLLKMGNEEQVSASQNQIINFFIRDKDTGYLIYKHCFYFNMDNDIIMDSDASWINDINLDNIEVIGSKNLCTFNWSWQDKRIDRVVRVNRTRVIPASRDNDSCHINFKMVDDRLICTSHIIEPKNYNIYDKLKIWVTRHQHPDSLIGSIDIPISFIEGKKTFEINYSHLGITSLKDVDFLTNNQYIKLHMEEKDGNTY